MWTSIVRGNVRTIHLFIGARLWRKITRNAKGGATPPASTVVSDLYQKIANNTYTFRPIYRPKQYREMSPITKFRL